jgi:ketosteroid isomerase-like protein
MGSPVTSDDTAIARRIHAAFAIGDMPAVLGAPSPTEHWTEAEVGPHGGVSIGPDDVLRNAFMRIGGEWDGFAVAPREFVAEGDAVVASGDYSDTYTATGRNFKAPFAHAWKFKDGLAVSFHQYTDTVVHRQPMAP